MAEFRCTLPPGWAFDCLRLLLEAGADKNKGDTMGDTLLHLAAATLRLDCLQLLHCLQLLLEAGADIDKVNTVGDTLHKAAGVGLLDRLWLLLEAGATHLLATRKATRRSTSPKPTTTRRPRRRF